MRVAAPRRRRLRLALALAGAGLLFALLGGLLFAVLREPRAPAGDWQVDEDLVADYDRLLRFDLPEYRIEPGTPEALMHLEPRWERLDRARGSIETSAGEGLLWLPGSGADTTLAFEAQAEWPAAERDHSVALSVNGTALLTLEVGGPTRFQARIPKQLLAPDGGTHASVSCRGRCSRLTLSEIRSSVAVADAVREGRCFPRGSFAAPDRLEQLPGAHLSLALRPRPGARFVAALPPRWRIGAVDYRVTLQPLSGPVLEVRRRNALWRTKLLEVPLEGLRGQPGRIRLEVSRPAGSGSAGAAGVWLHPRILSPARAPRLPERPARLPNVLLYVSDALRADHLEPYGYTRPVSPRLLAFSRQAQLFEHAYSQSVWTKPAVGSLLSGLLPEEHLAVDDLTSLGPAVRLLPAYLKPLGYSSLGLQANGNAGFRYGFDRGFDQFVELTQDYADIVTWNSSASAHARLSELLPTLREPWFVFVQVLDTHSPYGAEGAYARFLDGHPYRDRPLPGLFEAWLHGKARDPRDLALMTSYLKARYDGAVLHNDEYFGKLLDLLDGHGLGERTAVIFTADHGEAFREHGWEAGHSTLYEAITRVPLIVRPAGWRTAVRSLEPAQHVDIVPTVLGWAGLAPPSELPGRSLTELVGEGPHDPRSIHISFHPDREVGRFLTRGRAVVSWPYKLIQADVGRAAYEVYDLAADPAETRPMTGGMPRHVSLLVDFLLSEARRRPLAPSGPTRVETLSDEEREKLRALGYVQ